MFCQVFFGVFFAFQIGAFLVPPILVTFGNTELISFLIKKRPVIYEPQLLAILSPSL
nr:MAG TPA: hypothetical protein [Caudoviricetes sp.]